MSMPGQSQKATRRHALQKADAKQYTHVDASRRFRTAGPPRAANALECDRSSHPLHSLSVATFMSRKATGHLFFDGRMPLGPGSDDRSVFIIELPVWRHRNERHALRNFSPYCPSASPDGYLQSSPPRSPADLTATGEFYQERRPRKPKANQRADFAQVLEGLCESDYS
jgi:hypothetical protein